MVEPRDAASVIIIRDSPDLEVLMVRRNRNASFVPNMYVFPGGSIDADDYTDKIDDYCCGIKSKEACQIIPDLKPPGKAIGAYVAAIRETFEEVGILIAYDKDGSLLTLDTPEKKDKFMAFRQALAAGQIKFTDILEKAGLFLATDRLQYFSHWITPELAPIRFNVRFFVTEAPTSQASSHDGQELTAHSWIKPSEAIALCEQGKFDMVLPTIVNLAEISQHQTAKEVITATQRKRILTVLSELKFIDGKFIEVLPPGEAGDEMRKIYRGYK